MRQVYIDLTSENAHISNGNFVGYIGEHNATELLVSIPQDMVEQSDYQVLVMQSGPLVFKSGKILEDKTKPTYRVGNTIHTKLSKNLTINTSLSLQVECYKENEEGEKVLIGKTQSVSHLTLKPSPEGTPAFGYDGSFEDIEGAVEKAHTHINKEIIDKFSVDEDGTLLYDGKPIEGGGGSHDVPTFDTYDTPSQLPEDAAVGSLALVLGDDPVDEDEYTITVGKPLKPIRLKKDFDLDFSIVRQIYDEPMEGDMYQVAYGLKNAGDSNGGYYTMVGGIHVPELFNALMFMDYRKTAGDFAYKKESLDEYHTGTTLVVYNPGPPVPARLVFDNSHLTGSLPSGWFLLTYKEVITGVDEDLYYDYEYEYSVNTDPEAIAFAFEPYKNILLEAETYCNDKQAETEFLNAIFEVVSEPEKRKGLYYRGDDGWVNLTHSAQKENITVNSYLDLPKKATEGTLAYVAGNANQYTRESCYLNDTSYKRIYFRPFMSELTKFYDLKVQMDLYENQYTYVEDEQPEPEPEEPVDEPIDDENPDDEYYEEEPHNEPTGHWEYVPTKVKDGFYLETHNDENYISLSVTDPWSDSPDFYVYSYVDQTITYDDQGGQIQVSEGWNRVRSIDNGYSVELIVDLDDLPKLDSDRRGSDYYYRLISAEAVGYYKTSNFSTPLFSEYPFVRSDNAKGMWVFFGNRWQKIECSDHYEEVSAP